MPKGQKKFVVGLLLLLPLRHTFYFHTISQNTADTYIVNTPLERLRPTDVPFGGYKTETEYLGGFLPQNRFLVVATPPSE